MTASSVDNTRSSMDGSAVHVSAYVSDVCARAAAVADARKERIAAMLQEILESFKEYREGMKMLREDLAGDLGGSREEPRLEETLHKERQRKHVIHVGLWSPSMSEAVSIASSFQGVTLVEHKALKLRVTCDHSCDIAGLCLALGKCIEYGKRFIHTVNLNYFPD